MVCVHEIYYENFTFVFVSDVSVAWQQMLGVVQEFMNWSHWGLILILAFRVSLTHWIKLKF